MIYTAVFTPYVAAFLLNEPGYNVKQQESYGDDPIVVIDLIGNTVLLLKDNLIFFEKRKSFSLNFGVFFDWIIRLLNIWRDPVCTLKVQIGTT